MKNRGQFFLIASFVVIIVMSGFATLYVKAQFNKDDQATYDLSKELFQEGAQVIDHGVFNALSQAELEKNIINISNFYSASDPDREIIIVYGNESKIEALQYEKESYGSVGLSAGNDNGAGQEIKRKTIKKLENIPISGQTITIKVNEKDQYKFELKKGQNLFIILKKSTETEQFVSVKGRQTQ